MTFVTTKVSDPPHSQHVVQMTSRDMCTHVSYDVLAKFVTEQTQQCRHLPMNVIQFLTLGYRPMKGHLRGYLERMELEIERKELYAK